jgi:hypothetical protein
MTMTVNTLPAGWTVADTAHPDLAITRQNVDLLLDRGLIEIAMTSGKWWSIRRNGATKTFKKDAARIYIPFKYGFKFYGNITEADFGPCGTLNEKHFRIKV